MSSKGDKPSSKSDAKAETKPGIDAAAVRELAQLLKETDLTEIEIEHNGARIRVSRGGGVAAAVMPAPPAAPAAAPAVATSPSSPPPGAVLSPMVGTVYLSPEPGKPPFVALGQQVKVGDTLCIIEAMKTMNSIPSPFAGKVLEICVTDGQPVEFGQLLFVIG
jgi:acetyl-CoA carboxylase biotin carboxyl carrier protein